MTRGKNQYVVPHGKEWAVKGAGNEKATAIFPTQAEAIERAEEIAKTQHSDTKIHGRMEKSGQAIATATTHFRPRTRNKSVWNRDNEKRAYEAED